MRIFSGAALALALAACDRAPPTATQAVPEVERSPKIPCARGDAPLAPVCTLQRAPSGEGEVWTLRFPDGGFRRLTVQHGVVSAADGAERLRADGEDVTIAGERYRLPDE